MDLLVRIKRRPPTPGKVLEVGSLHTPSSCRLRNSTPISRDILPSRRIRAEHDSRRKTAGIRSRIHQRTGAAAR